MEHEEQQLGQSPPCEQDVELSEIERLRSKLERATEERDLYLKVFRHCHVTKAGDTSECASCGLDVRDEIHLRADSKIIGSVFIVHIYRATS